MKHYIIVKILYLQHSIVRISKGRFIGIERYIIIGKIKIVCQMIFCIITVFMSFES